MPPTLKLPFNRGIVELESNQGDAPWFYAKQASVDISTHRIY